MKLGRVEVRWVGIPYFWQNWFAMDRPKYESSLVFQVWLGPWLVRLYK